jgi:hypothetical protein
MKLYTVKERTITAFIQGPPVIEPRMLTYYLVGISFLLYCTCAFPCPRVRSRNLCWRMSLMRQQRCRMGYAEEPAKTALTLKLQDLCIFGRVPVPKPNAMVSTR